jgi:hypothetical protein
VTITKVTFTQSEGPATIQSWFGSSGGGLPGVLSCEVQGAFLLQSMMIAGSILVLRQVSQAGALRLSGLIRI